MNYEIYCSGMFDRRVAIEEQQLSPNSFGQAQYDTNDGSWATVAECWAKISPIWGQEMLRSGREIAQTWVTIDLRYGSGKVIQPKMRIRDKRTDECFDVRTVMHIDSARKIVELTCLKVE